MSSSCGLDGQGFGRATYQQEDIYLYSTCCVCARGSLRGGGHDAGTIDMIVCNVCTSAHAVTMLQYYCCGGVF